jgi:hypothetical protein
MGAPPRLTGILAGLLALPLVLCACGNGDSVADPPVSSAPTSSPTGTPHRESPEHFIRRWTKAEAKMENTGDTADYLALSRGCLACQELAHTIRQYYSAGGYVRWGGWRILSIEVNSKQHDATTYAVRNRSMPTTYRKARDSSLQHFSGGVTTELLQLARTHGTWRVTSKAELAS